VAHIPASTAPLTDLRFFSLFFSLFLSPSPASTGMNFDFECSYMVELEMRNVMMVTMVEERKKKKKKKDFKNSCGTDTQTRAATTLLPQLPPPPPPHTCIIE